MATAFSNCWRSPATLAELVGSEDRVHIAHIEDANLAGAAFLAGFVETAKKSGLVAELIERHKVRGLSVAPAA